MFERFTSDARAVVVQAQEQARRLGHNYIGCEHLLLAIAASGTGTARALEDVGVTPAAVEEAMHHLLGDHLFAAVDSEALAAIGIDLDLVRQRIEDGFGAHSHRLGSRRLWWGRRRPCRPVSGHIPFTGRAKKCLELALREAMNLHDGEIAVEHLALALTRKSDGVAPKVFAALGLSSAQIRTMLLDRRRQAG